MKKRGLILVIVLILIVSTSLFIFNRSTNQLTNSQKQAALAKILGRKPNLTDNGSKQDILYKGKLLTFIYPGSAKTYTPTLNGKALPKVSEESLIFDLGVPKIAFFMEADLQPTVVRSITDFPGVRLRQSQSNIYAQKEILVDGQKGLVFEKQDNRGFEKTAFFYKDSRVYSFSFQGADKMAVRELYSRIMASVNFLP